MHAIRAQSRSKYTTLVLMALVLALVALIGNSSRALALPPDGPAPDSPGTSSSVWPTEVKAGDQLFFEVSGYPANETVYIKIDDGLACSDTSHGACVYATQKLDSNGYASGSIIVPNLEPGGHWLRMLATGDVFDSQTGEKLGYEGYSRRGGNDFTVVAGGNAAAGSATGAGQPAEIGGGATQADGSIEGGSVAISVGDDVAQSATPEPPVDDMDALTTKVEDNPMSGAVTTSSESDLNVAAAETPQSQSPTSNFPVVGIAVLGGAVVVGGAAIAWALARQRKLSGTGSAPRE